MPTTAGDLSVRSHERVKCALPAELWVGERCQDQVRLAGTARNAQGAVGVTVVDCSLGGLGLSSPVFFPRGCRLRVRISCTEEAGAPPTVLEMTIAVQRVAMTDRAPSYYLGGSFEDAPEGSAKRLLDVVRGAARAGEHPRA